MTKTTVYLPDDLKFELHRVAAASGRSEAEVIREAIRAFVRGAEQPRPRGALFTSGDPSLSESVDPALAGFGER
jgi:plasmid stability protein